MLLVLCVAPVILDRNALKILIPDAVMQNLVSGSWDPLGPPVVGASGPLVRDISNIYESTMENRKQVGFLTLILAMTGSRMAC